MRPVAPSAAPLHIVDSARTPTTSPSAVLGWDIGGVNTKVALASGGALLGAHSRPYEVQHAPAALAPLLAELARSLDAPPGAAHAVTMTAELSQMFRTKRDGVGFVLDAVAAAFPEAHVRVYTVDGEFVTLAEARHAPLAVAAANWVATAHVVARAHADAVLIDVGTTSTDIVPIVGGRVAALGRTDPDRLRSGELLYTGALRTPVEAIVHEVPLGDGVAGVSAEGFALAGDAHLWRGTLAPADYTVAAPDSRPASREFAGERLARVVCADRELLDERAVDAIASCVADAQSARIAACITRVRARHPALQQAVVTGLGAFLAEAAAHRAGLSVMRLADSLGDDAARSAPAAAVALLLDAALRARTP